MTMQIEVSLSNALTGYRVEGLCRVWLDPFVNCICTPDCVATAIHGFNTGGLRSLINTQHMLRRTWEQAIVFFLPGSVVPLNRFIDLSEHIVRDENGRYLLTLDLLTKQE